MSATQIIGTLGVLCVSLGILLRKRRRQDELHFAGGVLLLMYSISIGDVVFSALQVVFVTTVIYDFWRTRFWRGEERAGQGKVG